MRLPNLAAVMRTLDFLTRHSGLPRVRVELVGDRPATCGQADARCLHERRYVRGEQFGGVVAVRLG